MPLPAPPVLPRVGPYLVDLDWCDDWDLNSTTPGPFQFGGNLYVVQLQRNSAAGRSLRIWKSVDGGATWAQVYSDPILIEFIDPMPGPSVRYIRMVYTISDILNTQRTWVVADWDMQTDTLAVLDDTLVTPLIGEFMGRAAYSPVSDRLIAFSKVPNVGNNLTLRTWEGGAWTAPVSFSELRPLGSDVEDVSVVPDTLGRFHAVYYHAAGGDIKHICYRQIRADGTLAASVEFSTEPASGTLLHWKAVLWGNQFLVPFRQLDVAVLPLLRYRAAVWSGVGLDAPVWSTFTVGQNWDYQTVQASTDGSMAYVWWAPAQIPSGLFLNQLEYCSFDGVESSPVTVIWDVRTDPPWPGWDERLWNLAQPVQIASWGCILNVDDPPVPPAPFVHGDGAVFLGFFQPPVPPPPPPQVSHGGFRRMVVLIPNQYDLCLLHQARSLRGLSYHDACCRRVVYHNLTHVRAPQSFLRFFKTAAIPTPLAAAGDVEILSFQIPHGYDGVIAGIFHGYTGPGFLEGNGDLEWRLLLNRVYAIHLGDVLVSLGSREQAFPIDGGIQVQSGQVVRYIVNAPNLSGGILPVNTQIYAGVEGLYYRRA